MHTHVYIHTYICVCTFVCTYAICTRAYPCSILKFHIKYVSVDSSQGFVEDQFGLGLIARAVEEGIAVIKPMGIMVFNIGGRPGQGVCTRLFERRGFRITKLWQKKIVQVCKDCVVLVHG